MTIQAKCAKAIRVALKAQFPEIKFSVTSESHSMMTAVRVSYTDGVLRARIEAIVSKYSYEDNKSNDLPQVRFVSVSRESSEEIKMQICEELGFGEDIEGYDAMGEYISTLVWREFCQREFGPYAAGQASDNEPEIEVITEGAEVDQVSAAFDSADTSNARQIDEFDPNAGEPFTHKLFIK